MKTRNGPLDVLFAVLPFADVASPAIAAGLLHAEIVRAGFSSRVRYFNLNFAALMGVERYRRVYDEFSARHLLGERIFAELLFKDQLPDADDYVAKVCMEYPRRRSSIRAVLKAGRHCQQFVEDCAGEILNRQPRIVAFTTTFQQTCACLAVARRIKQSAASPIIVFGGANCEGEMGLQLIRSFRGLIIFVREKVTLYYLPFLSDCSAKAIRVRFPACSKAARAWS
jgi:magnesium-protoporphyrin IX monomethyl ester (oxidative) cyclase